MSPLHDPPLPARLTAVGLVGHGPHRDIRVLRGVQEQPSMSNDQRSPFFGSGAGMDCLFSFRSVKCPMTFGLVSPKRFVGIQGFFSMKEASIPPVAKIAILVGVFLIGFILGRHSASSSTESAKAHDLAEKNQADLKVLCDSIQVVSDSIQQLASEFKANVKVEPTESESAKIIELVEKNRADVKTVNESVQHLIEELKAATEVEQTQSTPLPSPSGTDGKLARILVTNSAIEKKQLTEERLTGSASYKNVTSDNVHFIVSDLQAMNAILTSPELLDSMLVDRVELERNRLLEILKTQIPQLVKAIDEQAVKEADSKDALGKWAKGGAILGYYPASNIPNEAETIQKILTEHEGVRTRIALLQKQRYNVWACEHLKKAWQDFSDPDIASNQAKLETCKRFLGPIETSHLEPIAMELYRDFLEAIKKKVSIEDYQSLATSLSNSKRLMPGDRETSK